MNRATSATGWVRNPDGTLGYTWNPITGCLNGCSYCYARKLANGRLRSRYLANTNVAPSLSYPIELQDWSPFYPRFWSERLQIFKKRFVQLHTCITYPKKLGVFTCDMSDLFGIGIPEQWTRLVLEVIRINAYDRFYLLTKQPQNLIKFSPFPPNCYVGFTATNNLMFNYGLAYMSEIEAKVKYASLEPLLDSIEPVGIGSSILDWLILGSQTKPYKPPKIEWVEEIVEACDKAGMAVFLKDNLLKVLPVKEPFYKRDKSWVDPKLYYYRQEMPKFHPLNNP